MCSRSRRARITSASRRRPGPNTGGMGAYSPAPIVTPQLHARVMREIIQPTVRGMESEGIRYTGFLYAGLMIDAQGNPKTLEFNCRMGDPETQPIMARLKGDFSKVVELAIAGTLDSVGARMGPPHRARRRARRAQLSGHAAQWRPHQRHSRRNRDRRHVPRRHDARRRQADDFGRPGAVCRRIVGFGARRAIAWPTIQSTRFPSTACSIAATSVIARSTASRTIATADPVRRIRQYSRCRTFASGSAFFKGAL